ncbi:MAG: aspartate kinase [Gemmatimonadota bacterium]
MIVMKFGGTSVGDATAIRRGAEIVRGRIDRKPVVVVSAMSGVTNALFAIANDAIDGRLGAALDSVELLRARHHRELAALLGDDAAAAPARWEIDARFDEVGALAKALAVLGHATPRALDAIAATGERLSVGLVVAAYRAAGLPAVEVDARQVVVTDEAHTRAVPLPDAIAVAAERLVAPQLRDGKIPVMAGFVGATTGGVTSTLGRGGSAFSASLIGAALHADAIEIWTDVDGMLTADPRVVPDARLIAEIRFDEASELASFGAKVLHPSTIAPAVRLGIPVYVLNSMRPDGAGTRITTGAPRRSVTAIAGKRGTSVVKLRSSKMLLAHGFLRTIFEVFERHRTSVDVIATSEVEVSLTVDHDERLDVVLADLAGLADVSVERSLGIVSLVGAGLTDQTATIATAFAALGDITVHMLSLSSTGINLTVIVAEDHVTLAMQRLHAAFFPGRS